MSSHQDHEASSHHPTLSFVPTATQSIYDQIIAANTSPYTIYFRQMFMSFPFLMSLILFIYYYAHVNGMFDEVRVYMSSKFGNTENQRSIENDDEYYDDEKKKIIIEMKKSLLARVVKGNRFTRLLGFGKLTSDNISQYYEKEGWKYDKVTIVRNEQTFYFDVLQKSSSKNASSSTFSTLLLIPDIDGCLGENSCYLDSFIDGVCGNRNSLRLAASTKDSIHRIIIYSREGRSQNYPLTTSSNFKLLGDEQDLRYCIQQLAEKYRIGNNSNSHSISAQFIGVGWGFGANLLLSAVSGLASSNYFSMCISISNPYDIKNCMTTPMTRYHNMILQQLKKIVKNNWSVFQKHPHASLNLDELMASKTFIEFDTNFTLKINPELQDIPNDYYDTASCYHHLNDILSPTLLVSASDDPACSLSV
ncbi:hypothetical protein C9374_004350 [Naegleria lovaniensis]|uniref:Uncharacterized protein n=1 Tax=Naegleria lovaniensis TaxID=51637 RepID=A0AA88GR67_NAELO|nr:uncharacterized protein C9374_004350 [Naegleria lovaniensis]KAG2383679.1 hypothetical protein C9374_004350 [Naegleria lovaniensis]